MDPDAALSTLRAWAKPTRDPGDSDYEAVDAFRALDEWLSIGGFIPRGWGER